MMRPKADMYKKSMEFFVVVSLPVNLIICKSHEKSSNKQTAWIESLFWCFKTDQFFNLGEYKCLELSEKNDPQRSTFQISWEFFSKYG